MLENAGNSSLCRLVLNDNDLIASELDCISLNILLDLFSRKEAEEALGILVFNEDGFGTIKVRALLIKLVDRSREVNFQKRHQGVGELQDVIVRAKVDCELMDGDIIEAIGLIVVFLVENGSKILEPKSNPFRDVLGCVACKEESLLRDLTEHNKDGVREILHFVNHEIVDWDHVVPPISKLDKNVIDNVHQIVVVILNQPAFILNEELEDSIEHRFRYLLPHLAYIN